MGMLQDCIILPKSLDLLCFSLLSSLLFSAFPILPSTVFCVAEMSKEADLHGVRR